MTIFNTISRYRRIISAAFNVFSRRSVSDFTRSTHELVSLARKHPKSFFKAKIFTLPELYEAVSRSSSAERKGDNIRELIETFPLLVNFIAMTGERWCIGKIKDNAFDIFIAPERMIEIVNNNAQIYTALHIQTKRLYQYPTRQLSVDDWIAYVQEFIESKIMPVDFGIRGHVHLYNQIPFSSSVDIKLFRKKLKTLRISSNKWIDTISISLELVTKWNTVETVTWLVYPYVPRWVDVLPLDIQRANYVYAQSDAVNALLNYYNSLEKLPQNT